MENQEEYEMINKICKLGLIKDGMWMAALHDIEPVEIDLVQNGGAPIHMAVYKHKEDVGVLFWSNYNNVYAGKAELVFPGMGTRTGFVREIRFNLVGPMQGFPRLDIGTSQGKEWKKKVDTHYLPLRKAISAACKRLGVSTLIKEESGFCSAFRKIPGVSVVEDFGKIRSKCGSGSYGNEIVAFR